MKSLFVVFLVIAVSSDAYRLPLSQLRPAIGGSEDNLVQVARRLGLDILLKVATRLGLAEVLAEKSPLTLFGPTDKAFAEVPEYVIQHFLQNVTVLKDVILYHVLNDAVPSKAIEQDLLVPTLYSGMKIRFNIYGNPARVFTAQCAPIDLQSVDNKASNGLLHVLNRVMIPPFFGSVVGLVKQLPTEFSTLTLAVEKADLAALLSSSGPFTVFAPTNDAFAKIPKAELDHILSNPTLLKMVLKYHVVTGTYCSAGLTSGEITTAQGSNVTISVSQDGVMVNKATVIFPDAPVSNGVVHVIDTVLIPPTLKKQEV